MAKTTVYIITGYRWGDRQEHSYNVGVASKKSLAIKMADYHCQFRGGKYAFAVEECELDDLNHSKDDHVKEIYRAKSIRG